MKLAQLIAETGEQEAVIQVLCHLLGADRTTVFLLRDIGEETVKQVKKYVDKYKKGTPLAYLLGYTYFYNRKFLVNKNVLVPRFDTEVLIELAEKKIIADSVMDNMSQPYKILDLCCGAGVIGISLGYLTEWLNKKNPQDQYEITAADISQGALAVTQANAKLHNVDLHIIQSDLLDNIIGQFDLIVCNPPYIRTNEIGVADKRVLKEPRIALNGGLDGLYYYRRIMATIRDHLRPDGLLMFEVGYDQAEAVQEIAENNGFNNIKVYKDLANHDRVVTMEL